MTRARSLAVFLLLSASPAGAQDVMAGVEPAPDAEPAPEEAGEETIELSVPDWAVSLEVPDQAKASLGMYGEATRRFLEALSEGRPGSPDAGVALDAHRVVDACYRSAATSSASIVL